MSAAGHVRTDEERTDEERAIARPAEPRRRAPGLMQFSLATLLLVTTLIGVCLGIAVAAPSVGAPLIVIIVLAVIRTIAECRRMLRNGKAVDSYEKLNSFLRSLAVTVLTLVCTGLTLLVVSAAAIATVSAVIQLFVEILGGKAAGASTVGIPVLISAIAGLASAIGMFHWLYWTTIVTEPSHASRSR